MSTPQAVNPGRGPRRQRRQPRSAADSSSEPDQILHNLNGPNTPPAQIPRTSATFVPMTESAVTVSDDGASKKKRGRPKKQPQQPPAEVSAPPVTNNVPNHRYANSNPQNMVLSPERMKATPLKQAYAGPTFHASPAASSLPMPSFLTKSSSKTNGEISGQTERRRNDSKDSNSPPERPSSQDEVRDREASPLEFLFQAARAAKTSQHADSPCTQSETDISHVRAASNPPIARDQISPANRSRNHNRHPTDGSIDNMFPLEMDGSSTPEMVIGPAFATPYKDRMKALRSPNSPSNAPIHNLEEEQRKAKGDALKRFLMNPQPQRPASASARLREVSNPFDSPASAPNYIPQRHTSGPSTPVSYNSPNGVNRVTQSAYAQYPFPQQSFANYANGSPRPRPPSSNLRREVTPMNPAVELPASQYQISTRSTPRGTPAKDKPAEANGMDDLRRILKLNLTD
jgi:hypothetical protein